MSDKKMPTVVASGKVLPITEHIELRAARTGRPILLARSARFVWTLSLGILVHCQQQARRSARRLCRHGEDLEQSAQAKLAKRARIAARRMNSSGASELIANNVERFLHRHDIASRKDFERLQQQASQLSAAIAELKSRTSGDTQNPSEHFTLQ